MWRVTHQNMEFVSMLKTVRFTEIPTNIPNLLVIYLTDLNIYFITLYRPASNTSHDNETLLDFLYDFCKDKEVILQPPIY